MKIPLLIPYQLMEKTGYRLRALGRMLLSIYPAVKYDLDSMGVECDPEFYALAAFASSLILGVIFTGFAYVALLAKAEAGQSVEGTALLIGFGIFILLYLFYLLYPGLSAGRLVERADRDLIFALRDLSMQVSSGIPLYDAMLNVSTSGYGHISADLDVAVSEISSGTSEMAALQSMAFSSKSQYLKKAVLQLINSIGAGAGIGSALQSLVDSLEQNMFLSIKKYGGNLNFIILFYMLVAAALPSLGITFLILLSMFSGLGVGQDVIIMFMVFSIFCQVVIIGYIKSSRPIIY